MTRYAPHSVRDDEPRARLAVTPSLDSGAGNDLFVVYTPNWVEDAIRDRFAHLGRRAVSKVLNTQRF